MSDEPAKPAGEARGEVPVAETRAGAAPAPEEAAPEVAAVEGAAAEGAAPGEAVEEAAAAEEAVEEAAAPEEAPQEAQAGEAPPNDSAAAPKVVLVPPDEAMLRLAEAVLFASAGPVNARALSQVLPANADADAVIAELRARYAGRGVELADAGTGVMFRTAQDLAPSLRKVVHVPRRLPRVAMETLAIIAYHQPVTRAEIEEIRGAALAQSTLESLLEAELIMPKGRRETPGRPTLWGTTPHFLAQFGIGDLRELPRREDLLLELPVPTGAVKTEMAADAAPEAGAEPVAEPVAEAEGVAAGDDDHAASAVPSLASDP
jgi:segregation and condensation protein B